MIANSVLRLFLIMSILIILAGILLIVFNQIDRGYVFIGEEPDFRTQQKNLINHVYETQVNAQESGDSPLVMKLKKATVVIQSEAEEKPSEQIVAKVDDAAPPVAKTPPPTKPTEAPPQQNVFSTNPWEPYDEQGFDYQALLLRNNPWSPYYKPGH